MLFRCRIDKGLLKKANRVTKHLGTSTSEMVRIFVTQMARTQMLANNFGQQLAAANGGGDYYANNPGAGGDNYANAPGGAAYANIPG